jgi:hypothetical protein
VISRLARAFSVVEGHPAEGDGRLDDPGVVAKVLQPSQRVLGGGPGPLERVRRLDLPEVFIQHQGRTLGEHRITALFSGLDRLPGRLGARGEVVLFEQSLGQLEERSRSGGSLRDLGGAAQELLRDGEVPAFPRSLRRGDQPGGGRTPELLHRLVGRAQLPPVPIRLLEVVAEDLLVFGDTLARGALEPRGEPLVEVGSLLLGHRVVRRVAYQEVAESERVLTRELRTVGADQLLPGEGQQAGRYLWAEGLRRERPHGARVEDLALDGAAFDHGAFLRVQSVETGGEQQLDRRRHRDVREILDRSPRAVLEPEEPVVDEHAEHLLDEERVTLGGLQDPGSRVLGDLRATEQVVYEVGHLVPGEGLQQDLGGVQLPAAPVRTELQQLGSRDTQEQERRITRPVREVLDQIEEVRLRPVDVVEHAHERTLVREVFEELADAPLAVLCGDRLAPRQQSRDERHDAIAILGAVGEGRELRACRREIVRAFHAGRLLHDLDEREIRDALAVGEAPAAQDRGLGTRSRDELLNQPRLPDAGRP